MDLARLAAICAIVVAGTALSVPHVAAQTGFRGGQPVFQSDIERRERELEAARAERRKTYGNTVYPKYMDGGAKPDIAPEKPPAWGSRLTFSEPAVAAGREKARPNKTTASARAA